MDVRIFYVQAFPQRFWLEFTEDGLIEVNRELADKSDWGKSGLWIDAYFAGVGYDPPIEIWRYSFSGIMIDPLMVMGFGKLEHTRIGEPSPLPFFFIGSAMK